MRNREGCKREAERLKVGAGSPVFAPDAATRQAPAATIFTWHPASAGSLFFGKELELAGVAAMNW